MRPKRSFGQHFLHDIGVINDIVRAANIGPKDTVIEIGPGTGRLTKRLLRHLEAQESHSTPRLICVEYDDDMIAHLDHKFADYHNGQRPLLSLVRGDAAKFPWEQLLPEAESSSESTALIVSNLPYNASTAIYFHLLLNYRSKIRRMVLMFQREVALRLTSGRGSKAYGPPGILTDAVANTRRIAKVGPKSFRPPPRVHSAVLSIDPLDEPRYGLTHAELLPWYKMVQTLFQQRRKTITNNLKRIVGDRAKAILTSLEIDFSARPEELDAQTLVNLWRAVIEERL